MSEFQGSKKKERKRAFLERKAKRNWKFERRIALRKAIEKGDFGEALKLMR